MPVLCRTRRAACKRLRHWHDAEGTEGRRRRACCVRWPGMACTRRRVELLTVCAGATPRKGYAAKTTFRTSCRFRTSSSFRNEFICMYSRLLTTLGYREVCSRDQTCVVTRCKTRNEWEGIHAKAAGRVPGAHTLSTPARTRSPMYRVAPLKQLQGTMPTLRCSGALCIFIVHAVFRDTTLS